MDGATFHALLTRLRAGRGILPAQDSTAAQLDRARALVREHGVDSRARAVLVANAAGLYDAADALRYDSVPWNGTDPA